MIRQLGDDQVRFNLALSLHAATDKKRNEIMPINETNTIQSLIDALQLFYEKTKNDITLEYILFKDKTTASRMRKNLSRSTVRYPSPDQCDRIQPGGRYRFHETQ